MPRAEQGKLTVSESGWPGPERTYYDYQAGHECGGT